MLIHTGPKHVCDNNRLHFKVFKYIFKIHKKNYHSKDACNQFFFSSKYILLADDANILFQSSKLSTVCIISPNNKWRVNRIMDHLRGICHICWALYCRGKDIKPRPYSLELDRVSLNKCVCKMCRWCICSYEKCSLGGLEGVYFHPRVVKFRQRCLQKTTPADSS